MIYTNTTGRNDFVITKAAHTREQLSFFIQTRDPITPHTDPMWMLLLIDADQDASTGWLGYDYIVNHEVLDAQTTTIKRWDDGSWQNIGEARFATNGNGLDLIGEGDGSPAFDFHWADNIAGFGGVSELGVNGDSAPNRRWNYRYKVRD